MKNENAEEVEIDIVGSSTFGRYPKISLSKTYNMFISENWLVNYPGFKKKVEDIVPDGEGRGIFNSVRGGFLVVVISSSVYRINSNLVPVFIGSVATTTGDVYMDENLASQICIVDGENAYIYNYTSPGSFTVQTLTYIGNTIFPNYVCYHNSFFLFGNSPRSINSSNWYAFEPDKGTVTPPVAPDPTKIVFNSQFSIQTKPDVALVVTRLPGKGNNVLVLGSSVGEIWTQVGGLENYRRVQSFNIDNGIVSTETVAASENLVCWLSQNENLDISIMITDGTSTKRISTDGIDYVLSTIKFPLQSTGFFHREGGHLFYQLTFYNDADNLSLVYDFAEEKFFHVSDQNLDYHPARQIVFFNGVTYFISLDDGSIYSMSTDLLTYNYDIVPNSSGSEIPRIRICKTLRKKNSERFRVGSFTFFIEQGVNDYSSSNPIAPRVDMSFSKNGNQSFGSIVSKPINEVGHYRNQMTWSRIGQANEFTIQLEFWGFQRFVCSNGTAEIY